MEARYDTVVVGAGPAGLSAAAELARAGRCLLVEAGGAAATRDRHAARDLLAGVGGAGLFSDGKHSYYPSATALWALADAAALDDACRRTAAFLEGFGVDARALAPDAWRAPARAPADPPLAGWTPKRYPSIYAPLAARLAMIEALWGAASERLDETRVVAARRDGDALALELEGPRGRRVVTARALVVATGRSSPLGARPWLEALGVRFAFERVEVGVRLEAPAESPLFARLPGVDGKVVLRDAARDLELRSFCLCRRGEVVLGRADGLAAWSGRADGPPTARSNVGLVVRLRDPARGRAALAALAAAPAPASFPLGDGASLAARLAPWLGAAAAADVAWGVARLGALWPERDREPVTVHAPVVEGVGDYPCVAPDLAAAPGVWVAGDLAGRFRGLVAAMVSGRYVAARASAK